MTNKPSDTSVIAIIQARMGSTRLPGKVLMDLAGEPILFHVVERLRKTTAFKTVVVATTVSAADDRIERLCRERKWRCFRGSEEDVLDRYYKAAKHWEAHHIFRGTADDPLVCPAEAARLIAHHLKSGADYTHSVTVWGSGLPLGTGGEVFTFKALEASWREAKEAHHREGVDEYVYEHPERFRIEMLSAPTELRRPEFRLTVDTREDLELMRTIYQRLYQSGSIIDLRDAIKLLDREPALLEINKHVVQKRF